MHLTANQTLTHDLPRIVDVICGSKVPPALLRNELVEICHFPGTLIINVRRAVDLTGDVANFPEFFFRRDPPPALCCRRPRRSP